jgi:hypothetical protein
MKIGFAGAHRTGKTTLAKEVAKSTGIRFFETNVSQAPVWKEIHASPSDSFTFSERVEIQHRLMDYLGYQYAAQTEEAYVVDRTPLDILGYLFANLDHTCSNLWSDSAKSLITRSIYLVDNFFDRIFLVQPGIQTVVESGKTGKVFLSWSYQIAINNNIMAFGINHFDSKKFVIIPQNVLELEKRLRFVIDCL